MDAGAGAVAGSPSSRGGPGRERRERGVPSEPWMLAPVPWPGRRAREVARGGSGVSEACRANHGCCRRGLGGGRRSGGHHRQRAADRVLRAGPTNDIVGSLSMAALIPVIGYVWRRVPGDRVLAGLSATAVLASAAFAAAG